MRKFSLYLFLVTSLISFGFKIDTYKTAFSAERQYIYKSLDFESVIGVIENNEKVKIIKSFTKREKTIGHKIETKFKKKGFIKDNLKSYETFYKKIIFQSSTSKLIYDMKFKREFRKVDNNEEFKTSNLITEDGSYAYYRTELGFILKVNKLDDFKIVEIKGE